MSLVTYTELRQNLAHYMDETCDSRAPVFVTRQGGKKPVVLMSLEEFESWQETMHLISTPANAAELMASIAEADAGLAREHKLYDPDTAKSVR